MEKTVATVQECPDTEEKWNARALLKKCNTVCSTSEYHCVINKEMTAYIEVCATPRYMQGKCNKFYKFCAKYNRYFYSIYFACKKCCMIKNLQMIHV